MKKLLMILAILLAGCNPVKKVLNSDKYYPVVRDSVIARGECVNDTSFYVVGGKTIVKDSPVSVTVNAPCKDFADSVEAVSVASSGGKLVVKYRNKEIRRVDSFIRVVRDKSLERLLTAQIDNLKKELSDTKARHAVELNKKQAEVTAAKSDLKKWRKRFYILCSVISLLFFVRPIWRLLT